jgi:outer membrane protein assembly factor BamA
VRILSRLVVAIAVWILGAGTAVAIEEIHTEEDIADLLAEPPPSPEETAGRQWAILPEIGYGPDTGAVGGLKFTHRNVGGAGVTLDVDGTYAFEGQTDLSLVVGTPHLLNERFLMLARVRYYYDPQQEFFGLGDNDIGPDPVSTQSYEEWDAEGTFGWRPLPRLAIDLNVGVRHVRIGHGDKLDNPPRPFTVDAFPRLPGVEGGYVNPLGLSIVWTTRDEVLQPSRGWRAILKVAHTDRALLSDFQFTRVDADVGYLYPVFRGGHVLGLRLNGGFIDGPRRDVPFWELERLGGDDTLRGFFPRRFLGTQRVLGTLEYRFPLFGFDFFSIWHVRVGGVVFGEAGRVFISSGELRHEFTLNESTVSRVVSDLRYSYGGGLRIALSQALVARIDVGFSDEEKGLVYLAFGQAF